MRKAFQNLLLPFQKLGVVDLVLGSQLGHGLFFLQDFQDDFDLQIGAIVFSDGAHNVLTDPLFFCLNFGVHYTSEETLAYRQEEPSDIGTSPVQTIP
jgi:hypothetical protein